MCLVEEDHRAYPIAGGVREGRLQLAHQGGVDAGGLKAAGGGDFLAQVTLGQAGHLDVADLVARLRQVGEQHPQATVLPVPAGR